MSTSELRQIASVKQALNVHYIIEQKVIEHAVNNQSNKYNKPLVDCLSKLNKNILTSITLNNSTEENNLSILNVFIRQLYEGTAPLLAQEIVTKAIIEAKARDALLNDLTAREDKINVFEEIKTKESVIKLAAMLREIRQRRGHKDKITEELLVMVEKIEGIIDRCYVENSMVKVVADCIQGTHDCIAYIVARAIKQGNRFKNVTSIEATKRFNELLQQKVKDYVEKYANKGTATEQTIAKDLETVAKDIDNILISCHSEELVADINKCVQRTPDLTIAIINEVIQEAEATKKTDKI